MEYAFDITSCGVDFSCLREPQPRGRQNGFVTAVRYPDRGGLDRRRSAIWRQHCFGDFCRAAAACDSCGLCGIQCYVVRLTWKETSTMRPLCLWHGVSG